jgi:hypothetical protein
MNRKPLGQVRIALLSLGVLLAACGRQEPAAPAPAEPPDAHAVLMGMAEQLANSQGFSVTVRSGYDVVQADGQKIEFGETRRITLDRPDRLRIEVEQSDGDRRLVLVNGQDVTVHGITANLYAQTQMQGDIDQAITHITRDLRLRVPLALLLVTRLPAELENRVQSVDYVETTSINGAPAHHLAGRTEGVDFQAWVPAGDRPLPQRIVLTYKNEAGQPQYRAQFSDWNLSPRVKDSMFEFKPPSGVQKIAFLNQLPPPPGGGAKAAPRTGGRP